MLRWIHLRAQEAKAMSAEQRLRDQHDLQVSRLKVQIKRDGLTEEQGDALLKQLLRTQEAELEQQFLPRPRRRQTAQEKLIAMRNQARLRVEAISAAQREEQRQIQATRRVFQGEVVSYSASTRLALVRLPGGQVIPGRLLGRGAPVGSKVVVTIPLGSAIATIQTPEPRC